MPTLSLHPYAADDLRKLMVADNAAAAKVVALLEQAKIDPKIISSLLDHNFGANRTETYHVSKWLEFWNDGYNLWRLKIWEEPQGSLAYRIVYAYEPKALKYHVLAVVHRKFDYDPDHEITRRIIQTYKSLGITVH